MEKNRFVSNYSRAGKMIRAFMKANGFVGSVRGQSYSGGSSIVVRVSDLSPDRLAILKGYCDQFEYGSFNGMEDIYEYNNVRDDLPQVSYVFVENSMSDEFGQQIWEFVKNYYGGFNGAPNDYRDAGMFYNQNMNDYGQRIVYRVFSNSLSIFWDSSEQKLAA